MSDSEPLAVTDVRPFVPSEDFEQSLAFYTALGWSTLWTDGEGLALIGNARVAEPQQQDWGALVTYVWDPCGVLLHFTQLTA